MPADSARLTVVQQELVRRIRNCDVPRLTAVTWVIGACFGVFGIGLLAAGAMLRHRILIECGVIELLFCPILVLVRLRVLELFEIIQTLANEPRLDGPLCEP